MHEAIHPFFDATTGTLIPGHTPDLHLRASNTRDAFVRIRAERDAGLAPPSLLFQSVLVNLRAAALPPLEASGRRCFELPVGLYG